MPKSPKEFCRITDDPSYDYSDFVDGRGFYNDESRDDDRADELHDERRQEEVDRRDT